MENYKSGVYIKENNYRSFHPEPIYRKWEINNMEILQLLSQADRQLGRLDMYSEHVPNIDMYIRMHVLKEATQSSKIEGTQTNMEEALLDIEDVALDKRDDWQEVNNYILAINESLNSLENLPFSVRLIKQTHATLLQSGRGEYKQPGEFRHSQNWIGGATLRDAIFVPPPHYLIPDLMTDLEKFVHDEHHFVPDLIKVAIMHYQFETIHPFLDGNGRIGRLLITLYLIEKGILKKPILYLSTYFEKHRQLYYDNLMRVRNKNDMSQWIKFFLIGIIETTKNGVETFNEILTLKKDLETRIQEESKRGHNLYPILEHLYQNPIIDAKDVERITQLSTTTVYKIIEELENMGILKEITGGKRSKQYLFKQYLDLF